MRISESRIFVIVYLISSSALSNNCNDEYNEITNQLWSDSYYSDDSISEPEGVCPCGQAGPVFKRSVFKSLKSQCSADSCEDVAELCFNRSSVVLHTILCQSWYVPSRLSTGSFEMKCALKALRHVLREKAESILLPNFSPFSEEVKLGLCGPDFFLQDEVFLWKTKVGVGNQSDQSGQLSPSQNISIPTWAYPESTDVAGYFSLSTVSVNNGNRLHFNVLDELVKGIIPSLDRSAYEGSVLGEQMDVTTLDLQLAMTQRCGTNLSFHNGKVLLITPPLTHPLFNRGYVFFKVGGLQDSTLSALKTSSVSKEAEERVIIPSSTQETGLFTVDTAASYDSARVSNYPDDSSTEKELAYFFSVDGAKNLVLAAKKNLEDFRSTSVYPLKTQLEVQEIDETTKYITVDYWWSSTLACVVAGLVVYTICGISAVYREMKSPEEVQTPSSRISSSRFSQRGEIVQEMIINLLKQLVLFGSVGLYFIFLWAYYRKKCIDRFLKSSVLLMGIFVIFPLIVFPWVFGCVVFRGSYFLERYQSGRSGTVKCRFFLNQTLLCGGFVHFIILNSAVWPPAEEGCEGLRTHGIIFLILAYSLVVAAFLFVLIKYADIIPTAVNAFRALLFSSK